MTRYQERDRKSNLKRFNGLLVLCVLVGASLALSPSLRSAVFPPVDDSDRIAEAYAAKTSNVFFEAPAKVVWIYPEVDEHERYQEFVVRLENGHRMRIRHSLDEARRVPIDRDVQIRFRGEFDWTRDGGLVHWTHDDPDGRREGGWIEIGEQRYF